MSNIIQNIILANCVHYMVIVSHCFVNCEYNILNLYTEKNTKVIIKTEKTLAGSCK